MKATVSSKRNGGTRWKFTLELQRGEAGPLPGAPEALGLPELRVPRTSRGFRVTERQGMGPSEICL